MSTKALVDYGRLLDVLGIQAELLASAAHGAPRAALVPGCPGLTLGETVRHVGSIYRLVRSWLAERERPSRWRQEPGGGESLEDYFRAGLESLLVELDGKGADEACSTWWPEDETYGFWRRRMVHETVVHRIDVQGAAGMEVSPIPDDVAVDGVDEVLTLWFGRRLELLGVTGTRESRVAVRCGGREWLVVSGPEEHGTRMAAVSADGGSTTAGDRHVDAVISGQPDEVYLWLWGRWPPSVVSREGDEDAIAQLWALLRLATR